MASPQCENGHLDLANELVEQLAQTQLSGYESRILWAVWRKTYCWHKKEDWISYSQFQELTKIKHNSRIAEAKKSLLDRKIITEKRNKISFNKNYDQWLRKSVTQVTEKRNSLLRKSVHTKENPTKETITNNTNVLGADAPDRRNLELQDLIDFSKARQFSIQGSERQNRRYAFNLLRKKDDSGNPLGERVKWLVETAVKCRGVQYAPQVNDFKTLFYKWQDLLSYAQKERNGRSKNVIG